MKLADIRVDFVSDLESITGIDYKPLGFLVLEALEYFHNLIKEKNPEIQIVQVCGPISTGGKGSVELNIKHFKDCIGKLKKAGYAVFDQTPFEEKIWEIKERRRRAGLWLHYDWDLLMYIYLPLFESGFVDTACFLEDYQSSDGAKWEYDMCIKNKVRIIHWEFLNQQMKISIDFAMKYFIKDYKKMFGYVDDIFFCFENQTKNIFSKEELTSKSISIYHNNNNYCLDLYVHKNNIENIYNDILNRFKYFIEAA